MNGEERQWPLPNPRALPPSKPTHSHVSEDIDGLGGRDRAWEPSHGTSGGASDRTWEFSHGRHGAFICQGPLHPFPTPRILPPSNPPPSKVGDGLCIHGDGGGGAAGRGGSLQPMSLAELLEQFCKSSRPTGSAHTTANSSPNMVQILQPKISKPCGQLRTALV